ncbi:hypothetical protein CHARACLAT_031469 [Characodon lateralis]|uniref:Secreted protein n=1 Tax=Characodon lateralis TaxID=208331 RepID=A0ABU7EYZ6_9TELE|nr:hypothetical protein [Characodon lateralis]
MSPTFWSHSSFLFTLLFILGVPSWAPLDCDPTQNLLLLSLHQQVWVMQCGDESYPTHLQTSCFNKTSTHFHVARSLLMNVNELASKWGMCVTEFHYMIDFVIHLLIFELDPPLVDW